MKQKIIFRADGATDYGTFGNFKGEEAAVNLITLANAVTFGCSQHNPKWLIVRTTADKATANWFTFIDPIVVGHIVRTAVGKYSTPNQLKQLANQCLAKCGIAGYSYTNQQTGFDGAAALKFKTETLAKNAENVGKALVQLGKKLQKETELAYTIDSKYAGGGRVVKATVNNATVSFLIPYDSAKAEENRTEEHTEAVHKTQIAEETNKTAELENKTATYNQDTEEKKSKTTWSKTMRWIGIGTVAALLIGAVIFAVVKSKKK